MRDLTKTLSFLEEVEGLRLSPYLDRKGVPTIGIGTVYKSDGSKVTMQDEPITRETAELWAMDRIKRDAVKIEALCQPMILTDNQLTALLSFTYNEGFGAFATSTLLKVIRDDSGAAYTGAFEHWKHDVTEQFMAWDKITVNGVKVEDKGLKNRRVKECNLFFAEIKTA